MASELHIRATLHVHEGKIPEFRAICLEMAQIIAENDSGTKLWSVFLDEDSRAGVILEHFTDSPGLLDHAINAKHLFPRLYEVSDPGTIEVYGDPSREVVEMLKPFKGTTYYSSVAASS